MSDDADLFDGGSDDDAEPTSGHACPECGQEFANRVRLGMHRRAEHGILGKNASAAAGKGKRHASPRRPAGAAAAASRSSRSRKISESLTELVDLFERRTDNIDAHTLAEIIRRDADKIGEALAALADRRMFAPLGTAIDLLFGTGGPLSFLTALGPTVRKLLAGRTQARAERRAAAEHERAEADRLEAEYQAVLRDEGPDAARHWAATRGLQVVDDLAA